MFRRPSIRLVGVSVALAWSLAACSATGSDPPATSSRARAADWLPKAGAFTVLSINDTYRIEGLDGGERGGLARVRTLREQLEESGEPVLVLHAGDLFYPAFPSRKFGGAQVVDALNLLDGDDGGFDERMFATFGNHEFDDAKLSDAPAFATRIRQSQFRWLHTNLEFARGDEGKPLVAAENLVPSALIEIGGLRVGLFSLTLDEKVAAYVSRIADPLPVAREAVADLRGRGAEVVIALTHLRLDDDEALLRALGEDGPDLVFGGHEHERHAVDVGGRWILKADADAVSAAVVRVSRDRAGEVVVGQHRFADLDRSVAPDPEIDRRVREWLRAFELSYCVVDLGLTVDCLDEELGRTRVELVAEELEIRKFETNLGSWVADLARSAYRDLGAQIALVNSGSLRLNQNLPADSMVERRHLEELFAYPSPLLLIEIDGRTLEQMLEHSIEGWTGNGYWLQVSGVAFRHDPASETVSDLTLLPREAGASPRRIDPDERLRVVVPGFLVDPDGGQDGFTMIGPDDQVDAAGEPPDLKALVVEALRAAGEQGIAPGVEGRICSPQHPDPAPTCLAVNG